MPEEGITPSIITVLYLPEHNTAVKDRAEYEGTEEDLDQVVSIMYCLTKENT